MFPLCAKEKIYSASQDLRGRPRDKWSAGRAKLLTAGLEDERGGSLQTGEAASFCGAHLRLAPGSEVQQFLHLFLQIRNEFRKPFNEAARKEHHLWIDEIEEVRDGLSQIL